MSAQLLRFKLTLENSRKLNLLLQNECIFFGYILKVSFGFRIILFWFYDDCLYGLKILVLFVKKCFCDLGQELTGSLNAPVVFAHNDLLSGNLMLNDDEGTCEPQLSVRSNIVFFEEPYSVPCSHYVLLISRGTIFSLFCKITLNMRCTSSIMLIL